MGMWVVSMATVNSAALNIGVHVSFQITVLSGYMPRSIFKSRHITLPTKVRLVKAMVFPVVMFGY